MRRVCSHHELAIAESKKKEITLKELVEYGEGHLYECDSGGIAGERRQETNLVKRVLFLGEQLIGAEDGRAQAREKSERHGAQVSGAFTLQTEIHAIVDADPNAAKEYVTGGPRCVPLLSLDDCKNMLRDPPLDGAFLSKDGVQNYHSLLLRYVSSAVRVMSMEIEKGGVVLNGDNVSITFSPPSVSPDSDGNLSEQDITIPENHLPGDISLPPSIWQGSLLEAQRRSVEYAINCLQLNAPGAVKTLALVYDRFAGRFGGSCMRVRAEISFPRPRGGLIMDKWGYGKTPITLAVVAYWWWTRKEAKEDEEFFKKEEEDSSRGNSGEATSGRGKSSEGKPSSGDRRGQAGGGGGQAGKTSSGGQAGMSSSTVARPVLIVVPSHLVDQWKGEVKKFFRDGHPLRIRVLESTADVGRCDFEGGVDVVIVAVDVLRRDLFSGHGATKSVMAAVLWDWIVCDEFDQVVKMLGYGRFFPGIPVIGLLGNLNDFPVDSLAKTQQKLYGLWTGLTVFEQSVVENMGPVIDNFGKELFDRVPV